MERACLSIAKYRRDEAESGEIRVVGNEFWLMIDGARRAAVTIPSNAKTDTKQGLREAKQKARTIMAEEIAAYAKFTPENVMRYFHEPNSGWMRIIANDGKKYIVDNDGVSNAS